MFKNASLARVSGLTSAGDLGALAGLARFAHCGPTQPLAIGFVPPREQNGALCESVAGHWVMAVQIETRTVPASEIAKLVDRRAKEIEGETGRKAGKKQRRELKDEAVLELMPKAFPKLARVLVWIDPLQGLLVVDSSSTSKTDAVITLIVQALGLKVAPLTMQVAPAAMMRAWLHVAQGLGPFDLGTECELKAEGTKATVRYANLSVDAPEVRAHVAGGKAVRRLGLEWANGSAASFVLADDLTLRKIAMDIPSSNGYPADAFDADITMMMGALRVLIADLIEALGGEVRS